MTQPASKTPRKTAVSHRADASQRDLFQLDSPLIGEIHGERCKRRRKAALTWGYLAFRRRGAHFLASAAKRAWITSMLAEHERHGHRQGLPVPPRGIHAPDR